MSATDIITIGLVAGFTVFCLIMAALTVALLLEKDDDGEVPETFDLPRKIHEIEEEERNILNRL